MEIPTFNLSIIFLLFSLSIYLYNKYIFLFWKRRTIPFIKPTIFFGNLKPIFFRKISFSEHIVNLHRQIKSQGHKFGGIFSLTRPTLIVIDPELIKTMFVKDSVNFSDRGIYYDEDNDPLSAHLISIKNPKWQKLRSAFSPLFTPAKMKMAYPSFEERAKELVSVVEEYAQDGEAFEAGEIMARYTTDVLGQVALGVECNCLKNPNAEFRKVGIEYFQPDFKSSLIKFLGVTVPSILRIFKIPMTGPFATKFFLEAYKEILEYRENNYIAKKDLMSCLIQLKNNQSDEQNGGYNKKIKLTYNELASQAFIFLLVGFETSSSFMTYFLYEMAANEEIQNKLRKEIIQLIGNNDGITSYDVLMEMKYFDCVIKEVLRKYPTANKITRRSCKDYIIPGTDKVIPEGTLVLASIFALHMDPEYFSNPEKFDPDRFSESRKSELNFDNFCHLELALGIV